MSSFKVIVAVLALLAASALVAAQEEAAAPAAAPQQVQEEAAGATSAPPRALTAVERMAAVRDEMGRLQREMAVMSFLRNGYSSLVQNLAPLRSLDALSALTRTLNQQLMSAGVQYIDANVADVPQQMDYYRKLVGNENITSVCEVGFGAGHSALTFLFSNPNVRYVAFDTWQHDHQPLSLTVVESMFPGRLTVIKGKSNETLPVTIQTNPNLKCDVVVVDGSNDANDAVIDIVNLRRLAHADTVLLMDDLSCAGEQCVGPSTAYQAALKNGIVETDKCFRTEGGKRGFCQSHFLFGDDVALAAAKFQAMLAEAQAKQAAEAQQSEVTVEDVQE